MQIGSKLIKIADMKKGDRVYEADGFQIALLEIISDPERDDQLCTVEVKAKIVDHPFIQPGLILTLMESEGPDGYLSPKFYPAIVDDS